MSQAASNSTLDDVRSLRFGQSAQHRIWVELRRSAALWADGDARLGSWLVRSVLDTPDLPSLICRRLASIYADDAFGICALAQVIHGVLHEEPEMLDCICADLVAIQNRDPAVPDLLTPFLFLKGFAAVTCQRIAHHLWLKGDRPLALYLQHRVAGVSGIDLHPGAVIGRGILMDHATGVVIGETAVVGDEVTLFQSVTLGGTGKERGDRHPKVGRGVLIGAGAILLGNIRIGVGARIAAGAVVLSDVPEHYVAVGVPARLRPACSWPG